MKTIIILLITSLMISLMISFTGCNNKSKSSTEKTNNEHFSENETETETNLEIREQLFSKFSENKNKTISALKNLSAEQANDLYEKYFEENQTLISAMIELECDLLGYFYYTDEDTTVNNQIKTLEDVLKKNGLDFDEIGEGYVEIKTKPDFYYEIFHNHVTEDYKLYLSIKAEENQTLYSADAGLIITFTELGERIIVWENFLETFPESALIDKVKRICRHYRGDYLFGMDNTPTLERPYNGSIYIYPENLEEFNRFINQHPNSPTTTLIQFFMENFQEENIYELMREKQSEILTENP